jgi:hypothetical protein
MVLGNNVIDLDVEKYEEVNLKMDCHAMIRVIWQIREEELDGVLETRTSETRPDLISVAAAAIWSDSHATLTYTATVGGKGSDVARETLERVVHVCPGICTMSIMSDQEALCDEWNIAHMG